MQSFTSRVSRCHGSDLCQSHMGPEPDREDHATTSGTESFSSNAQPSFLEAVNPTWQSWQTRNVALFLMKLESCPLVPSSVVQNISSEIHSMNSLAQNRRLHVIGEVLKQPHVDDEVPGRVLSELSNENTFRSGWWCSANKIYDKTFTKESSK